MATQLETFLSQIPEAAWLAAAEELAPSVHPVDRNAFRIWFRFYPLGLHLHLAGAEDKADAMHKMAIQGDYNLAGHIDDSHRFLYGHRYWGEVKSVIEGLMASFTGAENLAALIDKVSADVSSKTGADKGLTIGISAVGLMTLNQVGGEAFKAAKGQAEKPAGIMTKSPDAIVAERKRDDSQGLFSFLKSVDKKFTVSWCDSSSQGSFKITNDADIATASDLDRSQDWRAKDSRCWEGVVPVECRSAACGLCWVGVLGGEEKLSEVQRLERKQMKVFGYQQPEDAKPYMRLACQAKVYGNSTVVIPPWNGVFGRKVYGVEDSKLEPATTSARKLRETLASVAEGEGGE